MIQVMHFQRKKVKLEDLRGETLRRGQIIFRDWSANLCMQCIEHMDPDIRCTQFANCKFEGLKQILEHILDIRAFGSRPDRAGHEDKFTLFSSLRQCYEKQGKLLRYIDYGHDTQMPCWDSSPSLQIVSCDDTEVTLKYNKSRAGC